MLASVRSFFSARGLLEVDTPLLVTSPGVEPHLEFFRVEPGGRWLNTSPETHMKRLLAEGSGPIFQVTRAFRANEYGHRHNPEFAILEWYRPNAGYLDLVQETRALLEHIASSLGIDPAAIPWCGNEIDLLAEPEIITVNQAFSRWAGVHPDELTGPSRLEQFSLLLVEQVEPHLGMGRISALTDYPADMASLARISPDDSTVAERLEIYVAGVELANAFSELTDPVEQRTRMELERAQRLQAGRAAPPLDEAFLEALTSMPPTAGIALGLDRLVMLFAGAEDIQEVIAFPWSEA